MRRTIVVTGASKGIGRAAAEMLAANGWYVIGIARHAVDNFPGEFLTCDLSDVAATTQLANQLAARGDIVGIVNNAGIARHEHFSNVAADDFANVLDYHLASRDLLHGIKSPIMNRRTCKPEMFLPRLQLVELEVQLINSSLALGQRNSPLHLIDFLQTLRTAPSVCAIRP